MTKVIRGGVAALSLGMALMVGALEVPARGAVDDSIDRMTLRAKVGQLVMFTVHGKTLTHAERDAIHSARLSNVILFDKNYANRTQVENLTDQIQRAARAGGGHAIGALIAVDQEGGIVKRFDDMPPTYSAPQMGTRDKSVAFDQGRATGRALRSVGVNVDLAPVADLDLEPEHVMRSRSFGSSPAPVGRRVKAFARGLQRADTAATAKHFPGLGGASRNSDSGPAYVHRSRYKLHHVDAVPFRIAIDGGLKMVMLSHGIYDKDGGSRPASVNHYIATERLRDELGFTGVAISDDLAVVAWWFDGSMSRACRATVWAGVDIALITGDVYAARACAGAIRDAVESGDISEDRIDRSVQRVLELKEWLGIYDPNA